MIGRGESGLIEALYDAALGGRPWTEVTQDILQHVGGQTLMLSTHHAGSGRVNVLGWLGMSTESLQQYPQFAPHDVWAMTFMDQRLYGRTVIGSQMVQDRVLERSLIYNEYLRPSVGAFRLVGTVVPLEGGYSAQLGIHRPRDAKDFSLGAARRMDRLLPHLQRALEVQHRLQQAEQASRSVYSVLDRLSFGVVVLTASGRLMHVNAAADAILRGADGLKRTPDGLRAIHKEDDKRLQALIGGLRQGSAGGHLRLRRPSGQPAYAVMIAPGGLAIANGARGEQTALVFISDPGGKIVSDLAVLAELFGFSPAEARLVLALMSGTALPEFARQAGITHNTARTLLARAMARTETRSQLELVLLIANSIGGTLAVPSGAS